MSNENILIMQANHKRLLRITEAALLAALAYVGFQFLRIDIAVAGGKTAFHFGNVFLLLATLLIGPFWGSIAGAVGMTLADLTSGYAMYAPSTFLLKMGFGLVCGTLAHKVLHINEAAGHKAVLRKTLISVSAGVIFNIIADPIVGYLFKRYIWQLPADAASILAKMSAVTTFVNGILAIVIVTSIYLTVRKPLMNAKLL